MSGRMSGFAPNANAASAAYAALFRLLNAALDEADEAYAMGTRYDPADELRCKVADANTAKVKAALRNLES